MEQLKKFEMQIGLFDKDTYKQEFSTEHAIQVISEIVGDCTIKADGLGFYTHDNGHKVDGEPSLTVIKFDTDKAKIVNMAKRLKKILNQESIILDEQPVTSEFI